MPDIFLVCEHLHCDFYFQEAMKFVENPQVAKDLDPGKLQVGHDLHHVSCGLLQ